MDNIRLFPVQLIESVWLFFLAILSLVTILNPHFIGENISMYVFGYGIGRFLLEFIRGDPNRVYILGFSEPQWTALAMGLVTIYIGFFGILPLHPWNIMVVIIMISTLFALLLQKYYRPPTIHQLKQPDHIMEIFQTLNWLNSQDSILALDVESHPITVMTGGTSLGIQITLSGFSEKQDYLKLYRLSHATGKLRNKSANTISKLIVMLKYNTADFKVLEKDNSTFELYIGGV